MSVDAGAVKRKLEEERAHLLARAIPAPEATRGDEADLAAMAEAKEQSIWLAQDQKQRLAQIDQALERIATGRYGICDQCGKTIAAERLEAIPHATLCVECQMKKERKRR